MSRKLLGILFILGFLLSISSKSFSQDVLCVHVNEGIYHLETEHAQLPNDNEEIHLKLLSEAPGKIFKISIDAPAERFNTPTPVSFNTTVYKKIVLIKTSTTNPLNPIEKVRLLI